LTKNRQLCDILLTKPGFFLDKSVVYEKVKELLISEFGLNADSITPEMLLYDDLQLDSLDMVDLIISLSNFIGKKISPSLFKEARIVQDLVDSIYPLWISA